MLSGDQLTGAEFLRSRAVAGIFDSPGFGKSAQLVRAIDTTGAGHVLVLCPPAAVRNFRNEYYKWTLIGLPVVELSSGADVLPDYPAIVVCNYVLAASAKMFKKLSRRNWCAIILDEAHHLKNPKGARTKAVFGAKGIGRRSKRIWFATGSPAQNGAHEYFVFLKCAGAWTGTYNQFIDRFCIVEDSHFGAKITGSNDETRPEIMTMLAAHSLCRETIEDGRAALSVDIADVAGSAPDYSEVEPEALEEIRRAVESGQWNLLDGAAIATIRRVTGVAAAMGISDLARAALDAGHKQMLIFADHTAVIDILAAELSKDLPGAISIIDGRTKSTLRERIIADFEPGENKPPPTFRVAICQRQSLKEARTMTGATRVILAEPAWNPEDNNQMIARAWRRGQSVPVHASFARLRGSIYDAVLAVAARKTADLNKFRAVSPANSANSLFA